MPSEDEIQERIIKALTAKLGDAPICPLCGHNNWNVNARYIVLSGSKHPVQTSLGGEGYPFIPITCANCGNTHLMNLLTLGFTASDWDSLRVDEDAKK